METEIEKIIEVDSTEKSVIPMKLYNPNGMDFKQDHRMKSIEVTDEYTRIDFIFRSSMVYTNGGWIQMERDAYIQPKGSTTKYRLVKAIGIPIAPIKHYFKQKGEFHTYTLIFPALPSATRCIDIIEKQAPGDYFNFYNVDYSKWMTVPHALDIPRKNN